MWHKVTVQNAMHVPLYMKTIVIGGRGVSHYSSFT